MFSFLEGHPEFSSSGDASGENLKLAKERLNGIAPDLIAFIEKFGHADIGDGDRDGDLFAIDKKTGEVIEFEHESSTVSSIRYESFSAFIKKTIEDA